MAHPSREKASLALVLMEMKAIHPPLFLLEVPSLISAPLSRPWPFTLYNKTALISFQ
jgi:hypothetical protein